MTQALRQEAFRGRGQGQGRRWRNALPAWIEQDREYQAMRQTIRHTLQVIADRADAPDDGGNLVGAFGGAALILACGCSRPAFWRHLNKLTAAGFVVLLRRGGTLGARQYGNVYGVPGLRGSLNHRRAARQMRRLIQSPDGRRVLDIIEPGQQPALFIAPDQDGAIIAADQDAATSSGGHSDGESETTPVSKRDYPPSQNETPPSPLTSAALKKTMRDGASRCSIRRRHGSEPRITAVTLADLRDTRRLLLLRDDAVARGLIRDNEQDRLRFVAAAEHALRVGDDPVKVFGAMVWRGRWLYLAACDEQAALDRLSRYARSQTSPPSPPEAPAASPSHVTQLSDDARVVRRVVAAVRLHRPRAVGDELWRLAALVLPVAGGWTRERFEAAVVDGGVR
jgi:hypothetical protein